MLIGLAAVYFHELIRKVLLGTVCDEVVHVVLREVDPLDVVLAVKGHPRA